MHIEFTLSDDSTREARDSDQPLNIVIAANFSGGHARAESASGSAVRGTMINIDPYDIDTAIAQLEPTVNVAEAGQSAAIHIKEIDDFHPDALYRHLDLFSVTQDLKRALSDPVLAAKAMTIASELTGIAADQKAPTAPTQVTPGDSDDELFSRLLGQNPGGGTKASETVKKLLADTVSVSDVPANANLMLDALDELDRDAMRDLLNQPQFRAVEAAWRSVEWFAQHIESDEGVSIWLLDVGNDHPCDWAHNAPERIRQSLAGEPVAMITVLHDFAATEASIAQLKALSELAASAACPVFAGAKAELAGLNGNISTHFAVDASSIAVDQTEAICQLRCAAPTGLGLGFPRMLLRQPYGKRTDPVDAFEFEELASAPDHEAFFWVSSAIGLAAAWLQQHLPSNQNLQIPDLALVTYDDGSGQAIKPASEIYLSDSAVEALLANGIIPLIARRGDTSVHIARFQSMSNPPTGL